MNENALDKTSIPPKGAGSAALFVSLYLVILAFFILLNALSKIDPDRTHQAIESVNDTFTAELEVPTLHRHEDERPMGENIALGDHFAILRKLIEETIHLTSVQVNAANNTMQMTFSANELFILRTANFQDDKLGFIQSIVQNIPVNPPNPIDMEFVISTPIHTIQNTSSSLEVERAGTFARKMIELGIPQRFISTGITPGKRNVITLSFYKRSVESSIVPSLGKEANE